MSGTLSCACWVSFLPPCPLSRAQQQVLAVPISTATSMSGQAIVISGLGHCGCLLVFPLPPLGPLLRAPHGGHGHGRPLLCVRVILWEHQGLSDAWNVLQSPSRGRLLVIIQVLCQYPQGDRPHFSIFSHITQWDELCGPIAGFLPGFCPGAPASPAPRDHVCLIHGCSDECQSGEGCGPAALGNTCPLPSSGSQLTEDKEGHLCTHNPVLSSSPGLSAAELLTCALPPSPPNVFPQPEAVSFWKGALGQRGALPAAWAPSPLSRCFLEKPLGDSAGLGLESLVFSPLGTRECSGRWPSRPDPPPYSL